MFDSFFATGTVCFCKFILLATDTLLTANAIILFIENVFFFWQHSLSGTETQRERETERESCGKLFCLLRGGVMVECYRGFTMSRTGTLQQKLWITHTLKKKKSNNAKWLVPPFYVRNMNTEGGKINSAGLWKQKKKSEDNFCKKTQNPRQTNPAECKMAAIKQMHENDTYKTALLVHT